jgi:hypothetical protein
MAGLAGAHVCYRFFVEKLNIQVVLEQWICEIPV